MTENEKITINNQLTEPINEADNTATVEFMEIKGEETSDDNISSHTYVAFDAISPEINSIRNSVDIAKPESVKLPKKENKILAATFCLLGNLFYVLSMFFHRLVNKNYKGFSSLSQNFYKSVFISVMTLIQIYGTPIAEIKKNLTNRKSLIGLNIRAILAFVNKLSLTFIGNNLRVSTSSTLSSINPIFTVIFAIFILKEKLKFMHIISLVVCIAGCLLIAKPWGDNHDKNNDSIEGYIWGGVNVLTKSFTPIIQKIISDNVHPGVQLFFTNLPSMVLSAILMPIFSASFDFVSYIALLYIAGAALGNFLNQYLIIKAIEKAEVTFIQIFYPSMIAYGFILTFLFTDDQNDYMDFIGAGIIMLVNIINTILIFVSQMKKKENKDKEDILNK